MSRIYKEKQQTKFKYQENNSINNGHVINRVLKRRNANDQENKMVSKCSTFLGIRKLQTRAALDFILPQSE